MECTSPCTGKCHPYFTQEEGSCLSEEDSGSDWMDLLHYYLGPGHIPKEQSPESMVEVENQEKDAQKTTEEHIPSTALSSPRKRKRGPYSVS